MTKANYGSIQLFTYKNSSKLYVQFRYEGKQQRISTKLEDTPKNRKYCEALIVQMEVDRLAGIFDPTLEKYLGISRNKPMGSNAVPSKSTTVVENPKPKSKQRYKTSRRAFRIPLETSQIKRFLEAIKNNEFSNPKSAFPVSFYHDAIATQFYLGLRNQELIGLKVRAIDFQKNLVTIDRVLARSKNCSHSRARIEKGTKNGKIRMIPLYGEVREILWKHCQGKNKDELVFTSYKGLALDDRAMQRRIIKPTLEKLGFRDVDLYSLRHHWVSFMLESKELSLAQIAYCSGHEVQTLVKHYAHILNLPQKLPEL